MRNLLIITILIGAQIGLCSDSVQADLPAQVGSSWEEVPIDASGANPFPLDTFALCSTRRESGFLFGGGEDFLVFPNQFPFADFTNNLYSWRVLDDPLRIKFELISSGRGPSERGFPEIVCTEDKVFVFGGVDELFTTVVDSFWEYDMNADQWTFLSGISPSPSPKNGVTMQLRKGEIFLFGGILSAPFLGIFEMSDEMWKFDTKNHSWTFMTPPGTSEDPKPKHLARSGIVELSDAQMLIFGGERFEPTPENPFNFPIDVEVHLMNLKSGDLVRLADGPQQNYEAFACNENRCLMFGGDIPGACGSTPQNVTDDTWLFEVATNSWEQLELANAPNPAKRSRGAWVDGFFYNFGGFDVICVDPDTGTIQKVSETRVHRLRLDE